VNSITTREVVPVEFRARLLKPRAARLKLHNTFWEWSDEWIEPDGTVFDLMYRSCDLIEADVEARLGRGEASVGYSTCLCHSVLQARPVFDRRGWFHALQDGVKSTPYPDRLVKGVINKNLPVLGGRYPFLRAADPLGLPPPGPSQPQPPDRGVASLASYFDILFAANRRFNPGEKRLLTHAQALPVVPEGVAADVEAACRGPAAWTAAWPTTSSSCACGWSAFYALKGYTLP
jgi:hypothetical protein